MSEPAGPSLEEVYAAIPPVACRGLCQDSCGPIATSRLEEERLAGRGVRLPSMPDAVAAVPAGEDYACPALAEGACTVHDIRPTICRLWGATRSMPCPHGCTPDDALTQEESWELLKRAAEAGGGMVTRHLPVTAGQVAGHRRRRRPRS